MLRNMVYYDIKTSEEELKSVFIGTIHGLQPFASSSLIMNQLRRLIISSR